MEKEGEMDISMRAAEGNRKQGRIKREEMRRRG